MYDFISISHGTTGIPGNLHLFLHLRSGRCHRLPKPKHPLTGSDRVIGIVPVPGIGGAAGSTGYRPLFTSEIERVVIHSVINNCALSRAHSWPNQHCWPICSRMTAHSVKASCIAGFPTSGGLFVRFNGKLMT
jgi:hypothetical protein